MQRRNFLGAAGIGLAGAATAGASAAAGARAPTSPPAVPRGARILVRGGYIVSQDPKVGAFRGDVLIDNGKFAAIGRTLEVAGAETIDASDMIVMPGFIETHRHTWQSCL